LSSIEHHDAQIRIMNNSGQVIRYIDYQNASSPAINVKELAAGIYFIEVQIGKKFYFGKFIRQ
jgi:bifunctional N-acetylglucosamine-1-phosphate-uridyltransferase/glucosamine-1-phosphate-acetyltransferase GlmU-like protein